MTTVSGVCLKPFLLFYIHSNCEVTDYGKDYDK